MTADNVQRKCHPANIKLSLQTLKTTNFTDFLLKKESSVGQEFFCLYVIQTFITVFIKANLILS